MRDPWDVHFLKLARVISERATCPRKSVGAVLVNAQHHVCSVGYNGSLPGLCHCTDVGCDMVDGHCVRTIHAEVNAVLQAARQGISVEGATLYCTASPCLQCFKMVATAGIRRIVYPEVYGDPEAFKKIMNLAHLMDVELRRVG